MPRVSADGLASDFGWSVSLTDHVGSIALSPDGERVAAVGTTGPIAIIAIADGEVITTIDAHASAATTIAWNPRTGFLASGGQDGKVNEWSAEGAPRWSTLVQTAWVEALTWDRQGRNLAAASGRSLAMLDADGATRWSADDDVSTITDLAWHPEGNALASIAYGGIALREATGPNPTRRVAWTGSGLCLAWSPDGRFIAAGDQDATVYIIFAKTGRKLQMWGFPRKVRSSPGIAAVDGSPPAEVTLRRYGTPRERMDPKDACRYRWRDTRGPCAPSPGRPPTTSSPQDATMGSCTSGRRAHARIR